MPYYQVVSGIDSLKRGHFPTGIETLHIKNIWKEFAMTKDNIKELWEKLLSGEPITINKIKNKIEKDIAESFIKYNKNNNIFRYYSLYCYENFNQYMGICECKDHELYLNKIISKEIAYSEIVDAAKEIKE